eukprot:scaffold8624_cov110-Isochrysis_galbana.AAC.6
MRRPQRDPAATGEGSSTAPPMARAYRSSASVVPRRLPSPPQAQLGECRYGLRPTAVERLKKQTHFKSIIQI